MEKFKVLPKVEAVYRLSINCSLFIDGFKTDVYRSLVKEQELYLKKFELEKGERLLMFLPSRVFMGFTLELNTKIFIPNSNEHSMREGLLGAIKLPVTTFIWTDAFLLPQRYFLRDYCFAKISHDDFLSFAEI